MTEYECPRAKLTTNKIEKIQGSISFRVSKDPAVLEVAKMVTAGIYGPPSLHPRYEAWLARYGQRKTEELIHDAVTIAGACDIIQTDMELGGVGLFGGLSEKGLAGDKSEFVFYEWLSPEDGQLTTIVTSGEARDIVNRRKRVIEFRRAPRSESLLT
ncbi:hypothetical protein HYW46_04995 [Candidatus Daviesbacteria bacterium]|nr:hypothetical protein [Candidatus Daviesbacteria bacterium]